VDRQLRGRSGRQGDVGSSVFFVSLEDDLMRLFGSDRISKLMDQMGYEEGEVLEHKMISNSIERAQKKVEENNFGVRKRLLEYDDVMNAQRNVVYAKRRHALMGERIGVDITNMIYDTAETIVGEMRDVLDYEGLNSELLKVFAMEAPFDEDTFKSAKEQSLVEQVMEAAINAFKRKMDKMATVAQPIIKQVYETKGEQYQNIVMPVTDGKRVFSITTNLKDAYESQCKELVKSFEKFALLYVIDDEWKEHLRQLDELRQSVQNASYEQKDPLLIYKLESFNLFKNMIDNVNRKVIAILMRGQIPMREPEQVRQAQETKRMDMSRYRTQKDSGVPGNDPTKQDTREIQRPEPFRAEKKVGRNDPCPCGSGLKYKNCHGK
jgi:preprotein translocase subunit SecA